MMSKLIIKIGGSMMKDLKKSYCSPKKENANSHTLYLKDADAFGKILSPKRIELLLHIIAIQKQKRTLGEIAEELKRKQEAVSRDVNLLAEHGLIKKIKEGQKLYLKGAYTALEIQLS